VVRVGVDPGGGAVGIVDGHLQAEGMDLEHHGVFVLEILSEGDLRPVPR
jgi:hypothetical protein